MPIRIQVEKSPVTHSAEEEAYLRRLIKVAGQKRARSLWAAVQSDSGLASSEYRCALYEGALRLYETGDDSGVRESLMVHGAPVGPEEFLLSPYYLNAQEVLWPKLMDEFIELNSPNKPYIEALCVGGIGSGKTTLALYTTAYQLYLLSCMKAPHYRFGLDPTSEIVFIFQSLNLNLSTDVDYRRFREIITRSPYFTTVFSFNQKLEGKMVFPNRIEARPLSGTDTAALGSNVIGGMIDELNNMAIVEESRKARAGVYDQAIMLYNAISRRRKSRFMQRGKLPGILCLVSSKQYPGQFTDTKQEEARTDPTIFVYDKRTWDVQPADRFTGKWFDLYLGSEIKKPRILADGEKEKLSAEDRALVMSVPLEHKADFERDIYSAIRDIAGMSTVARSPYMFEFDNVAKCFGKRKSVLNLEETDFGPGPRLTFDPKKFKDKQFKRWVHIDLGLTSDAAGVACCYVDRFVKVRRGVLIETLPHVSVDFLLRVKPPLGGEIKFFKIRDLIYKLRKHGLPIAWVSFDTFQSVDSMQMMRAQGFITGNISADTNLDVYEFAKTALYDVRVDATAHAHCLKELRGLEFNAKDKKVDHASHGSKDVSDALATSIYGLTTRREVWHQFGISVAQIPSSLKSAVEKEERRDAKRERREAAS